MTDVVCYCQVVVGGGDCNDDVGADVVVAAASASAAVEADCLNVDVLVQVNSCAVVIAVTAVVVVVLKYVEVAVSVVVAANNIMTDNVYGFIFVKLERSLYNPDSFSFFFHLSKHGLNFLHH